jgi:hypothetical protein
VIVSGILPWVYGPDYFFALKYNLLSYISGIWSENREYTYRISLCAPYWKRCSPAGEDLAGVRAIMGDDHPESTIRKRGARKPFPEEL